MAKPSTTSRTRVTDAALERRLERLGLTGKEEDWTDRYLLCEHLVDPPTARPRQRFEAVARFIRDLVAHRWVKTRQARENANPKRVYYLSMEFLIGRTLNNNMMNLAAEPLVQGAMKREGWNFPELLEEEPDAGLGNGGLGRLAACFIDSLASDAPVFSYGLRPPLRVRDLSPSDPRWLPGGGTRQVAASSRPVGDRPARQDVPGTTQRQY
jgi:glycogen phosphorylase